MRWLTEEEQRYQEIEQEHTQQAKQVMKKLWKCETGQPVTLTTNEAYELLYYIASLGGLKAIWH